MVPLLAPERQQPADGGPEGQVGWIDAVVILAVVAGMAFVIKDWDGGLSAQEYGEIIGAAVAAAVAVYAVPNRTAYLPEG